MAAASFVGTFVFDCAGQYTNDSTNITVLGDNVTSSNVKKGKFFWYGPKSSELSLDVGQTGNINNNLTNINNQKGDYAGTVTPYEDEYMKIEANGNVTVKQKFSEKRTYKIKTTTKRNKFTETKDEDDENVCVISDEVDEDSWEVES